MKLDYIIGFLGILALVFIGGCEDAPVDTADDPPVDSLPPVETDPWQQFLDSHRIPMLSPDSTLGFLRYETFRTMRNRAGDYGDSSIAEAFFWRDGVLADIGWVRLTYSVLEHIDTGIYRFVNPVLSDDKELKWMIVGIEGINFAPIHQQPSAIDTVSIRPGDTVSRAAGLQGTYRGFERGRLMVALDVDTFRNRGWLGIDSTLAQKPIVREVADMGMFQITPADLGMMIPNRYYRLSLSHHRSMQIRVVERSIAWRDRTTYSTYIYLVP